MRTNVRGPLSSRVTDLERLRKLEIVKSRITQCLVKQNILNIEERLACFTFAGTIDRVVVIDGELWIIDIKTTSSIHPHVGVQLAAYVALSEGYYGGTYRRAALQLRGDGSFKVTEFSSWNDETCFNALLGIYHWQTQ